MGSTMGSDAVGGGDAVVGGGDGEIGTADLEAALAQSVERLRRGDFMDQVQVDDTAALGAPGFFVNYVGVPDFFDECAWVLS